MGGKVEEALVMGRLEILNGTRLVCREMGVFWF